jgi:hypothetical protein
MVMVVLPLAMLRYTTTGLLLVLRPRQSTTRLARTLVPLLYDPTKRQRDLESEDTRAGGEGLEEERERERNGLNLRDGRPRLVI